MTAVNAGVGAVGAKVVNEGYSLLSDRKKRSKVSKSIRRAVFPHTKRRKSRRVSRHKAGKRKTHRVPTPKHRRKSANRR